jgi:VWFA-related protein
MRLPRIAARPIVLILAAVPLLAQKPVFRAGVDVVSVDVSVALGGEHVGRLTTEDFEVFDNDVRQTITGVTFERVPLEVYLVLDLSGSVGGLKLHELKQAASAFGDGLAAPDQIALLTFGKTVSVRQELTSNIQAFKYSLFEAASGGNTALRDAVAKAISLREPRRNRAIVVVCADDHDNASKASWGEVYRAAERSDVTVFGVMAPDYRVTAADGGSVGLHYGAQYQSGFVWSLARATGGRVFRSGTGLPLAEVLAMVLDDARSRYVLTYSPDKATPGWHRLDVKLVGAKGDVVARRGYFVGK